MGIDKRGGRRGRMGTDRGSGVGGGESGDRQKEEWGRKWREWDGRGREWG